MRGSCCDLLKAAPLRVLSDPLHSLGIGEIRSVLRSFHEINERRLYVRLQLREFCHSSGNEFILGIAIDFLGHGGGKTTGLIRRLKVAQVSAL